jgi:hypothetical protein
MASHIQGTFTAVIGFVDPGALRKTCCSSVDLVANVLHVLTHGTDVIITLTIIVELVDAERVLSGRPFSAVATLWAYSQIWANCFLIFSLLVAIAFRQTKVYLLAR